MPLGFHSLNDVRHETTSEHELVDIVAVHDLYEDSFEAWTHPETGALWLRDFLPDHIRAARVLAYGYDSSALSFFTSDAPERVQRLAESLVQELRANRQFAGSLRRPIIFVCHGMGGVIVKKSLIYSSSRTAPKVSHLWDQFVSTFAVVFFGTPHGHIVTSNWLDFETHASTSSSLSRRSSSFSPLRRLTRRPDEGDTDPQLPRLVDMDFAPLVKQFHILYLWEERPTRLGDRWEFLVPPHSAAPAIDNTESAGIHATHSQMTKFQSRESSDYRTVIAALSAYCEKAPAIISNRWKRADRHLIQLRIGEIQEIGGFTFDCHVEEREPVQHHKRNAQRHFYLPEGRTSTYIGREDILKSLSRSFFPGGSPVSKDGHKSFVVFGMGGCGKTELCSKFASDNQHQYTAIFTIHAASNETIKESYSRIGELAGLQPTENAGRHFLTQQTEPWLLIIDNADDGTLPLRSLFPSGNSAHILVTTRNRDFSREGTLGSLELKGLREDEAVQLLLTKADIPLPWDDPITKAASRITKALGYLALALIQAGTCVYRGVCKLGSYLDIHSEARQRLGKKELSTSQGQTGNTIATVYSTFDVSLGLLLKNPIETSRQDASDLLSIFGFFHFEFIPLDIFSRAVIKRDAELKSGSSPQDRTWTSTIIQEVFRRMSPPVPLPGFLKPIDGKLDKYRINWALAELQSLSFIRFDGKYVSLHPLIHDWARDRLSSSERHLWSSIALNTLMSSISLPPESSSEKDGNFHRDLIPHLDHCLSEHGAPLREEIRAMWGLRFQIAKVCQPTFLLIVRDQIQQHAKCGYVFAERGHFGKSAQHLEIVRDMLIKVLGYRDEKTMTAMLGLAGVYWGLGRLEEAIALQQTVVSNRSQLLGLTHESTLQAMDQLGKSYWLHGQYREALELQQTTADQMRRTLGVKNPQTLAALDNLGVTLGAWRKFEDSFQVHNEVLAARLDMESFGKSHLDTLTTKANLAMALLDLGKTDQAKDIMTEVYQERQKQLGKEHPWTLWALCYLAKVDLEMGRYQQAEDLLTWGIEAGVRSLNEDHLGVLMGCGHLAQVYARTDRLEEAERLTLDIIRKIQPSRGTAHPDCVYAFLKLAQLYVLKGEHDKAIQYCEVGLERADMRITREHPLARDLEQLLDQLRAAGTTGDSVDSDVTTLAESRRESETTSLRALSTCYDRDGTLIEGEPTRSGPNQEMVEPRGTPVENIEGLPPG
ncbi:hypothetical protein V8F20_003186 [Naviculisporaceae sp. PSN 640]